MEDGNISISIQQESFPPPLSFKDPGSSSSSTIIQEKAVKMEADDDTELSSNSDENFPNFVLQAGKQKVEEANVFKVPLSKKATKDTKSKVLKRRNFYRD